MNAKWLAGFGSLTLGLTFGLFSLNAAADTPPTSRTLHYDVQFHDTIIAKDPSTLQLGDQFILSDVVLADGQQVGHDGGVCTITDAAGEAVCTVVYSLPDGTITTQFLNIPPPDKTFAITGGSGRYQNARGQGELIENGDETGTLNFTLSDS
jgi:allene oxide cyclase-like protein